MKTLSKSLTKQEFLTATLKSLYDLTGVAESRWSEWFNSKRTLTLTKIQELAQKLEMSPIEFVEAFLERQGKTRGS